MTFMSLKKPKNGKGNPNKDGGNTGKVVDEFDKNSKLYVMQKSVDAKEAKVDQLTNELREAREKLETTSLSMKNPNNSIEDVKSLGEHKFTLSSSVRSLEAQLERAKQLRRDADIELNKIERRCYELRCWYSSALNGAEHLSFISAVNADKAKIAELEMNIANLRKRQEQKQNARAEEYRSWTGREIASEPAPNEDVPEMSEVSIPRGTGRPRMGAAAWASAVDR